MSVSQVPDNLAVSSATPPGEEVSAEPTFPTSGLRKVSVGLLLVYVAILAINSGGLGILIPNLVARIDEADKVDNLALVTTLAFLVNVFAQPIAGALSDVTRSRFGRRTPWMVGGGLVAAGFLVGLPMAGSVIVIAAGLDGRAAGRQRAAGRGDRAGARPLPAGQARRRLRHGRHGHHHRQRRRRGGRRLDRQPGRCCRTSCWPS